MYKRQAIASSTDSIYLNLVFERLGIRDYFSFFTTPDTSKAKKSDPEFWQYAIDKLKADPADIILYDDALYAIKAANKMGIKTCGVKDFPYNEREWEDIKKEASLYLDTIADINKDNILGK